MHDTFKSRYSGKSGDTYTEPAAQMNTIDLGMAKALHETSLLMDHPRVRALVITGAGEKAFCAGGDLRL